MNKNRKSGFYWVLAGHYWRVAEYDGSFWYFQGARYDKDECWADILEERLLDPFETRKR